MATLVVLVLVAAVLGSVFYWSGRYGDPKRNRGTSLRRAASAHTTRDGRPKKAYATREEAEAHARSTGPAGAMSAYKCGTCDKWHVGH
ncbi:MAG: hypothetical protein ABSA07_08670 [Acidimicrobiales bacterium]|jgi:hypothetical protein